MNYALVGAFVLVLGAALVAGALWLAAGGATKKKQDLYLAVSDESVSGLNVNAPVKYNGVDVGKVRDIRLDPEHPERVNLMFELDEGTPVKVDTVAVLRIQGLTGIAYVELSGGTPAAARLRETAGSEYPVIPTKPSLSARLENVLTDVLAKIDNTSTGINELLSTENKAAFKSALADIAAVAKTVAARRETLDAGIASAARTFENASRASVKFGPAIDRIESAADAVEKMGDAVAQMGDEVARTSLSAGKTADSIGADVKRFTSETLPEVERLLGELRVLSASLRRLTEQTERDPRGLLFGRTQVPEGPGESKGRE